MSHTIRLTAGLWLVETALEDFAVRGALLRGGNLAVAWDTLARPEDMEGVAELAAERPLIVVYSHGDWDHVWGTAGLSGGWDEVIAHESCLPRFRTDLPATLEEKRRSAAGYDRVRLIPPTRTFRKHLALDLGHLSLELHSLPGHTPDSLVGYVTEWNLLLAGDAVETPLPFLNPGSPLVPWANELEAWAERMAASTASNSRAPVVVPAHGAVGGLELLHGTASYLRALSDGREPPLPGNLSPFYRETHAANLRLSGVRQGR